MSGAAPSLRTVIFRVAAGPRRGFGHLVRCRSLAAALGVDPRVSIRGGAATRVTAASFGWTVLDVDSDRRLLSMNPALLVIDDPSTAATRAWVRRARRLGIPVTSIHDLGRGYAASDLVIDGSILARRRPQNVDALLGTGYAILHPSFATMGDAPVRSSRRVLIALGGGAHVRQLARTLCQEIARLAPHADIRVARGFVSDRREPVLPAGRWVSAPRGLAAELSQATVALVAGGITLYEACALGIPAVGFALTDDQQRTVSAFARRGAAIDAASRSKTREGTPEGTVPNLSRTCPQPVPNLSPKRAAAAIAALLSDERRRRRQAASARALVDGRGAIRVAYHLERLIQGRKGAHAA